MRNLVLVVLFLIAIGSFVNAGQIVYLNDYQIIAMFDAGVVTMPSGKDSTDIDSVSFSPSSIKTMLVNQGAESIEKVFPDYDHSNPNVTSPLDNSITVKSYPFDRIFFITLDSHESRDATIDSLETYSAVVYAEINPAIETQSRYVFTNEDTYFADSLWNLDYSADTTAVCAHGAIDIMPAWGYTTGNTSTRIGICDKGIENDHPEFSNRLYGDLDINDDAVENYPDDFNHSYHVTGIAAAKGNNGSGVAGIHWNARIYFRPFAEFFPDTLEVTNQPYLNSFMVPENIISLAESDGCLVINNSWALRNSWEDPQYPFYSRTYHMIMAHVNRLGTLLVFSRGNAGVTGDSTQFYPACCGEFILNVGASERPADSTIDKAQFSHYGEGMDLLAPGGTTDGINRTLDEYDVFSCYKNNSYGRMTGTSMAAPHVTGVAALLHDHVKELHDLDFLNDDLQECIKICAYRNTGHFNNYNPLTHGKGLLDAATTLRETDSTKVIFHRIHADSGTVTSTVVANGMDIEFYLPDTTNIMYGDEVTCNVYRVEKEIEYDDYTQEIDLGTAADYLIWGNSLYKSTDAGHGGVEYPLHYEHQNNTTPPTWSTQDFCYGTEYCSVDTADLDGCTLISYAIRDNDGNWITTAPDDIEFYFTIVVDDQIPPTAVQDFAASPGLDSTVRLTWAGNNECDLECYKLYRKVAYLDPLTLLATISKDSTGYTDSDYVFTDSSNFYHAFYQIFAIDRNNNISTGSDTLHVEVLPAEKRPGNGSNLLPEKTELLPIYPNPFNSMATVQYTLKKPAPVELKIFNMIGQNIYSRNYSTQDAGYYSQTINFSDYGTGVYVVTIRIGDYSSKQKIVMIK